MAAKVQKKPQPKLLPELRISSSFIPSLSVILTVTTVTTVADSAGEFELVDVFVCLTETSGVIVKNVVVGVDYLLVFGG